METALVSFYQVLAGEHIDKQLTPLGSLFLRFFARLIPQISVLNYFKILQGKFNEVWGIGKKKTFYMIKCLLGINAKGIEFRCVNDIMFKWRV